MPSHSNISDSNFTQMMFLCISFHIFKNIIYMNLLSMVELTSVTIRAINICVQRLFYASPLHGTSFMQVFTKELYVYKNHVESRVIRTHSLSLFPHAYFCFSIYYWLFFFSRRPPIYYEEYFNTRVSYSMSYGSQTTIT